MKIVCYDNNASAEATQILRELAADAVKQGNTVIWQNPNPFQPEMMIADANWVYLCSHGAKQEQVLAAYKQRNIPVQFVSDAEFIRHYDQKQQKAPAAVVEKPKRQTTRRSKKS